MTPKKQFYFIPVVSEFEFFLLHLIVQTKVDASELAQSPNNASELKSFLGLATLCSRFIPNYSTLTGPLRQLLKHNASFHWKPVHENAFMELKNTLKNTLSKD